MAEREVRLQRAKWVGHNRIRLRFDPFEARYIRLKVLARDHYRCYWCGSYGDTIDHIIPWSRGGRTNLINCITACQVCNNQRGDLPAEEFARLRGVPMPRLTGNEPIPRVQLRRGLKAPAAGQPAEKPARPVVELTPQARAAVARALEEELEVPARPDGAADGGKARSRRRRRRRGGRQEAAAAASAGAADSAAAAATSMAAADSAAAAATSVAAADSAAAAATSMAAVVAQGEPADSAAQPEPPAERIGRVLLIARLLEGRGSPLSRRQLL